ncbi:hypothetical protein ElyMa_006361500 [Elysia marginata]|uniref:Secreted protein n=1 Tax=Elysia marginata TaxID=1093978 RepID=A0AAV4HL86_9GAST|nr:hypothetical protein ElyMa_006361500 [Elysia marginata]
MMPYLDRSLSSLIVIYVQFSHDCLCPRRGDEGQALRPATPRPWHGHTKVKDAVSLNQNMPCPRGRVMEVKTTPDLPIRRGTR